MKKRLFVLLILAALLCGIFCGCGTPAAEQSASLSPETSPTPEPTPTPDPTPEPTPELQTLKKKDELKAYLIERLDAGEREITFKFTGNANLVKTYSLVQMLGLFGAEISRDPADKSIYMMSVIETPGARMVRAFQTGDTAVLVSADEKAAYDVLLQMVNAIKAQIEASDPVTLEYALINAICEMATPLSNESNDFIAAEAALNPEFTALGVFLNGSANSYGYSDAFYAAGTIAGLEVDFMYVKKAGEIDAVDPILELSNTVYLDDQWYIVHCGETDRAREQYGLKYKFVNRGVESRTFHDWFDAAEKHELALGSYGTALQEMDVIPELATQEDLRCWIATCLERNVPQDVRIIPFRYVGTESVVDIPLGYFALGHPIYLQKSKDSQGVVYYLFVAKSSGEKIADAYFNNNYENLTNDEKHALIVASDLVAAANNENLDLLKKELFLHDKIAMLSHKGNDDSGGFVDAYGIHPHNTAVGVLLYNEGKCQGYTDAFYAIAKIAGFNVGKLIVDDGNHIVNTISFDGQNWYIVDLTFNDWDDQNNVGHFIFNVGLDRYKSSSVNALWMWYPIAETSNPEYLVE